MEIRIYVNHRDRTVLNEKDFERLVADNAKEYADDGDRFSEWLDENYSTVEIFRMTEAKRANVLAKWEKVAYDDVRSDMTCEYGGEWTEYVIEV